MKPITLNDCATYLGMNKSALCKFVKRSKGTTFSHFINKLRLRQAVYLLEKEDLPINEIAYNCGFTNIPYFNKIFKRNYSCPPSQYRLKFRKAKT